MGAGVPPDGCGGIGTVHVPGGAATTPGVSSSRRGRTRANRTADDKTKAKESDIQASYRDGILEVRAPLDESAPKPSKIPISRT